MQLDFFRTSAVAPLIVAYGMGVDSTALLVGYAKDITDWQSFITSTCDGCTACAAA